MWPLGALLGCGYRERSPGCGVPYCMDCCREVLPHRRKFRNVCSRHRSGTVVLSQTVSVAAGCGAVTSRLCGCRCGARLWLLGAVSGLRRTAPL